MVKHLPTSAADMGLIPDLGRSHTLRSNSVCEPQNSRACAPEPAQSNDREARTAAKTQHSQKLKPKGVRRHILYLLVGQQYFSNKLRKGACTHRLSSEIAPKAAMLVLQICAKAQIRLLTLTIRERSKLIKVHSTL